MDNLQWENELLGKYNDKSQKKLLWIPFTTWCYKYLLYKNCLYRLYFTNSLEKDGQLSIFSLLFLLPTYRGCRISYPYPIMSLRLNHHWHNSKPVCYLGEWRPGCWIGWPAFFHQFFPLRTATIRNGRPQCVTYNSTFMQSSFSKLLVESHLKTASLIDIADIWKENVKVWVTPMDLYYEMHFHFYTVLISRFWSIAKSVISCHDKFYTLCKKFNMAANIVQIQSSYLQ